MHIVVANESSAFFEFIIGQIGFASTVFVRFEICFALLLVYSRRRIKMFQRCCGFVCNQDSLSSGASIFYFFKD
jgi:hypothetical protein